MHGYNADAEIEIERLGRVISAAEPWAPQYEKDPDSHAALIKAEGKIETALRGYFRTLANERLDAIVDWYMYLTIKGYDIDVTIKDDPMNAEAGILLSVVFDPLLDAVAAGAAAGESIYEIPLGMTSATDVIIGAARNHAAALVGKKVQADGTIIDNPNAEYSINDTTRNQIRESLKTSISLGEDQKAASARVSKIIKNVKRAGTIAQTEAVNSYSIGLDQFGFQSGAVSSTWQSLAGAEPICAALDEKTVKLGEPFTTITGREIYGPAAHTGCRCGKRLNYQNHA